jgi:hypothetical protein
MEIKNLTQEQVDALKAPLPPDAVKPHPTKNYLSTIKVIYVVERLNEVFGINGWFTDDKVVEKDGKMVVVHTTLTIPEYGIVKSAFGGNDNSDLGDAYKGACTDALSKIGSFLYIGMDVYKGLEAPPAAPKKAPAKTPAKPPEPAPAAAKQEPQSAPKTTEILRGKIGSDIKQNDKGTWIKVGTHPVHLWDFDKHIRDNAITAGSEVEVEVLPKQGAKGKYYELVRVLTAVPVEGAA